MFPEISLFGLTVPTYFVFLSFVFSLIVFLIPYRAKYYKLSAVKALDLYMLSILGGFIGARLFYVLYQEQGFYFSHPLEILYFWKGGFVFYGGFLGGLATFLIFCRLKEEDLFVWLNFSAPLLSLGYLLGRLSCLLAGCCYGEKTEAWYAVFLHGAYRHPTQIYAFLSESVVLAALLFVERRRPKRLFPLYAFWMAGHAIGRLIMEYFRADPRGQSVLGLSVSSFISLLILVSGLGLFFYHVYVARPKK